MYKKMTALLGEKEYVLNVEANCFYEFFQDKTGQDYFDLVKNQKGYSDVIQFVKGLIYAGHMAESEIEGTNHTITKEEVDKFVRFMTPEQTTKIFNDYNALMGAQKKEGE
jgi:hypothetical protein